jgi:hypothetical protein
VVLVLLCLLALALGLDPPLPLALRFLSLELLVIRLEALVWLSLPPSLLFICFRVYGLA